MHFETMGKHYLLFTGESEQCFLGGAGFQPSTVPRICLGRSSVLENLMKHKHVTRWTVFRGERDSG